MVEPRSPSEIAENVQCRQRQDCDTWSTLRSQECITAPNDKPCVPGYGLPISHTAEEHYNRRNGASCLAVEGVTMRELLMLEIMNNLTDKEGWDHKVFDNTITAKWRTEAQSHGLDISEKMLDWCLAELKDKALVYRENGITTVLETTVAVVKSDKVVSEETRERLKAAVAPLEAVPDAEKDWHPGSEDRVLDLVHPSLCPLIYGRTRILAHGRVGLEHCTAHSGQGEVIVAPEEDDTKPPSRHHNVHDIDPWSRKFQWLPSDIAFDPNGKPKFVSYINNLHPEHHEQLYRVIEEVLYAAVALWNVCLSYAAYPASSRIELQHTSYDFPLGQRRPESAMNAYEDVEDWVQANRVHEDNENWIRANRVLIRPEPETYRSLAPLSDEQCINLNRVYEKSGLQVIVKLANLHLTPEKPTYEGGSWHFEGLNNEHIIASSIYYYDSENISDSQLCFRHSFDPQSIEEKQWEQDDYEGVEQLYGVKQDEPAIQDIGCVSTRQGRLLAFLNVLQHRVAPFKLADATKPGHRKILAFFLVDPQIKIMSTANVPPQQKHWWAEEMHRLGALQRLPQEIQDRVVEFVPEFPISLAEAKELRKELMAERTMSVEAVNAKWKANEISFCEH